MSASNRGKGPLSLLAVPAMAVVFIGGLLFGWVGALVGIAVAVAAGLVWERET